MPKGFARIRQKNLAILKRQTITAKPTKRRPKKQPKRRSKKQRRSPQMRALIKRLRLEHLR